MTSAPRKIVQPDAPPPPGCPPRSPWRSVFVTLVAWSAIMAVLWLFPGDEVRSYVAEPIRPLAHATPLEFLVVWLIGCLGLSAVIRDAAEHRRTEAALRHREQVYQSVVENIDVGIALIDVDHTVAAVNPAQARMLGKNVDQLVGKKCYREFEKREAVCPHCPGAKAMATGRAAEVDTLGIRDDGSQFAARVRAFPVVGPDGAPTGFVELVEDVTQRKRAEQYQQHAREAAEAANRAKSEFLANMSHEIRTPLTAILGFAELIADASDLSEAREAAETIRRNGSHLLQILSDVLDISKIEAARLDPQYARCSPREIVAEVASLMKVRADAKGLDFAVEYEGPIPPTICTDATRLRQILINLVGNAVKFTEAGSVRVVTRLVAEDGREPKMRFDVIDTGIGIEPTQIGLLFEPFTQVDGSSHRRFGGSGLGLSISKHLAEMLGGDVAVRSSPGLGSTFTATVSTGPLEAIETEEETSETPGPPAPCPAGRTSLPYRLLLAEDGPDNRRLFSFVLHHAGAQVTLAGNGREAVELALAARRDGRPFDAILMDIQMPVLDGYAATARLRHEGYAGPILALTAHAMPEDRQKCLRAGCDDYIVKPVAAPELVRRVADHLARVDWPTCQEHAEA